MLSRGSIFLQGETTEEEEDVDDDDVVVDVDDVVADDDGGGFRKDCPLSKACKSCKIHATVSYEEKKKHTHTWECYCQLIYSSESISVIRVSSTME